MTFKGFVATVVFGCVPQLLSGQSNAQTVYTGDARYVAVDYSRLIAASQADQGQLMLRFQLIEASSTRPASATRDPAIAAVDTVLRDLFRYSTYQLISEAVVAATDGARTSQILSGRGETYSLTVFVSDGSPQRVGGRGGSGDPANAMIATRIEVTLMSTTPVADTRRLEPPGAPGTADAGTAVKMGVPPVTRPSNQLLLRTTVTVTPGHTVVLGSTQPGGTDRALVLVMKTEMKKY